MKITDKIIWDDNLIARNRIVMSPMDTVSARDGVANAFHVQHYGSRAFGGVGTIIVEATAVSSEGRIKENDLGLWHDKHVEPLSKVVEAAHQGGSVIGVQLNHAGSKTEAKNVTTLGVTKLFNRSNKENFDFLTEDRFEEIEEVFVLAAYRAKRAGFDFIELHGAHGYLLNTILNPAFNDLWSEPSLLKRADIIIRIASRIYNEVQIPVGIRLSVHDHDERGIQPQDLEAFIKAIEPYLIYFNVSSGGTLRAIDTFSQKEKIFRLPLAEEIRKITKKALIVTGNITSREDVEKVLAGGIDAAGVGRELLLNPYLVVNHLLTPEETDSKFYGLNDNPWYNHGEYRAKKIEHKW